MRRFIAYGPAFVVLLTVTAVLLAGPSLVRRIGSAQTAARIVLAQRSLDDDDILERLNAAVRGVAAAVEPSVVHIEVISSGGRRLAGRSTGSGWVYDDQGHIITNAHVVRGAAAITVQFSDGHTVQAQPIRGDIFVADPYTDIAVIKVPSDSGLFPLRRATGAQPQQGDRVFVFGSPFGFKFSMSEGIVSGLGRDPSSSAELNGFTNFIQTDAAVNPGNSGGPLVDIKGRIVGMNVAIATGRDSDGTTAENGQSAGISFAIPLGTIESVVDQLITTGEVRRGFMGLRWPQIRSATDPVYQQELRTSGIRVAEVTKDGPAAAGGLKSGDLILAIAGQATPTYPVLRSVITTIPPGKTIPVKVYRNDEGVKELTITVGEYTEVQVGLNTSAALESLARYGLGIVRSRRGALNEQPAVINEVLPDSPAAAAGFAAGQKVLQVGETPVSNAAELCLAAAEQGLLLGKRIEFLIAEEDGDTSTAPRTIEVQIVR